MSNKQVIATPHRCKHFSPIHHMWSENETDKRQTDKTFFFFSKCRQCCVKLTEMCSFYTWKCFSFVLSFLKKCSSCCFMLTCLYFVSPQLYLLPGRRLPVEVKNVTLNCEESTIITLSGNTWNNMQIRPRLWTFNWWKIAVCLRGDCTWQPGLWHLLFYICWYLFPAAPPYRPV